MVNISLMQLHWKKQRTNTDGAILQTISLPRILLYYYHFYNQHYKLQRHSICVPTKSPEGKEGKYHNEVDQGRYQSEPEIEKKFKSSMLLAYPLIAADSDI